MSSVWEDNSTTGTSEAVIENSDTPLAPLVTNIYATFWDFLMEPIEGLSYSIHVGEQQVAGTTGADGKASPILGATPGDDVQVYVKRQYDGEYKYIGSTIAPAGDFPLAIVSPKVLTEVETDLHEGAPGNVKAPVITQQSARAKVKAEPIVDRTLTTGRNDKGHPMAVSKPCPEWLERNLPAVCNLWTWADFQGPKPTPPAKGDNAKAKSNNAKKPDQPPTHADPRVFRNGTWGLDSMLPGLLGTKPQPIEGLSEADSVKLKALIEFAERQVKIKYPFPGITTVEIKAKYAKYPAKRPEEIFPDSKENVSIERCLPYVKAALWRSGYVQGVTSTIPAKDSGKDWEAFGFKNISSTLPQVEITYEVKSGSFKHSQPDISYTAPGDVIVYDQIGVPSAYGHVDIRTYHGFVSDFQWAVYPKLGGVKGKYRVVGVYRKFSDMVALARVKAFLRIIREHEAKDFSDPYRALHWDGKKHITFSDFSTHPSNKDEDKPAGAYQIIFTTWEDKLKVTGWPQTMTTAIQDRLAIYLLQERPLGKSPPHPRHSALGYIMEGDVEKAVNETKLWELFAFLPGGKKQQQITMPELKADFDKYVKEYSK